MCLLSVKLQLLTPGLRNEKNNNYFRKEASILRKNRVITIPIELYLSVKKYSEEKGLTVPEFVRYLLSAYINKEERRKNNEEKA